MRTETVSGIKITYPDYMVWDEDNNIVMVQVTQGTASITATIGTRTVGYAGTGASVIVDISQLLKRNGTYGAKTLDVTAADGTVTVTRSYNIFVCRGRTLADRYHYSPRSIILPSLMPTVDICVADACTVSGGASTVSYASAGVYQYALSGSGVITVTYANKIWQGDQNDPVFSKTTDYQVEVLSCYPDRGAIIGWYDCDGCRRYAMGKVIGRGTKAETADFTATDFTSALGTVRDTAGRLVTKTQRTLDVGLSQVAESLHLEEIILSDEVWLVKPSDGRAIPLVPEFDALDVLANMNNDMVLKFRIQQ